MSSLGIFFVNNFINVILCLCCDKLFFLLIIVKALDEMKDLSENLKETEELSTDAQTVAHDALASIDARHQVIKDSIEIGKRNFMIFGFQLIFEIVTDKCILGF